VGRVEGKVAFVTGGAKGLGLSDALALAKEGADIAIFDLGDGHRDAEPGYPLGTQADLDAAVAAVEQLGRRGLGLVGDVRNQEDLDAAVRQTVDTFGHLDILVANAGVALMGADWEMTRADWDLMLGTNLTGVWQSCKAVIPQMIKQKGGRIILRSSSAGFKSASWLGAYCAGKAAVIALGRSLAIDLGQYYITVNSICPSTVDSGTNRGMAYKYGFDWDSKAPEWIASQIIPKMLEPRDISNVTVFLASDEARYLTGVALPVDAGYTAK
jgi:NAD(P)-dependent dehydrogenase (short-subunit alcohol dehydrogenase family)